MFHIILKIPVKCIDNAFVVGQCLEGNRVNKVRRILCHQYMHIAVKLCEHTGEIGNLVCGNAAGYSEYDCLSF